MNILVAKKCKQWEIYRNICDMHGDAFFSENVQKLTKNIFAKTIQCQKSKSMESKHTDSPVNFQEQHSLKKVLLTTCWDMKGFIIADLLYHC